MSGEASNSQTSPREHSKREHESESDSHRRRRHHRRSRRVTHDELAGASPSNAKDVSDVSDSTAVVKVPRRKAAQSAFKDRDAEASKALHAAVSVTEEGHIKGGDFIKSIVYGSMDGLITTFAVVTAVVGGDLEIGSVLILGFANMLGDGISMGMGDFLSSSAENEFAKRERAREMWECENDIEAERREMIELYSQKGLSPEDAKTVVGIISKNHDTFVDIMMVEELGIMPPDPADKPWKNGIVTFVAFCICGSVPLLPYIAHVSINGPKTKALPSDAAFGVAIGLTAITMFTLGAITSKFTAQHWLKAGLFTLLNGGIAAIASYGIAVLVNYIFGVKV